MEVMKQENFRSVEPSSDETVRKSGVWEAEFATSVLVPVSTCRARGASRETEQRKEEVVEVGKLAGLVGLASRRVKE